MTPLIQQQSKAQHVLGSSVQNQGSHPITWPAKELRAARATMTATAKINRAIVATTQQSPTPN